MKRQEKLNTNQIAQLKEYLRTSEFKKEAYRIQAALIVNRDMDIEIIKEMNSLAVRRYSICEKSTWKKA